MRLVVHKPTKFDICRRYCRENVLPFQSADVHSGGCKAVSMPRANGEFCCFPVTLHHLTGHKTGARLATQVIFAFAVKAVTASLAEAFHKRKTKIATVLERSGRVLSFCLQGA